MEHEFAVGRDFYQAGEVGLVRGRVDDRVFVVIEKSEEAVEVNIDGGGLHHCRIPGVQGDAALAHGTQNINIGK